MGCAKELIQLTRAECQGGLVLAESLEVLYTDGPAGGAKFTTGRASRIVRRRSSVALLLLHNLRKKALVYFNIVEHAHENDPVWKIHQRNFSPSCSEELLNPLSVATTNCDGIFDSVNFVKPPPTTLPAALP